MKISEFRKLKQINPLITVNMYLAFRQRLRSHYRIYGSVSFAVKRRFYQEYINASASALQQFLALRVSEQNRQQKLLKEIYSSDKALAARLL